MIDPIVQYESAPFSYSSFSISSILAKGIVAADLPYEGVWVPVKWATAASVELVAEGTASAIEADVWGTNQSNPTNTYTVTVGGTITAADVVNLTFAGENLPSAGIEISHAVTSEDTTTTIAGALAAAIAANATLAAIGVIASSAAAILTVNFPSTAPGGEAAGWSSTGPTQPSTPPAANTLIVAQSVSESATETLTIANGTDGTNLTPSHLTAAGLTAVTPMPVRFVKARIVTLTGSGLTVTLGFAAAE